MQEEGLGTRLHEMNMFGLVTPIFVVNSELTQISFVCVIHIKLTPGLEHT